jgi:hypothetical protein
MKITGGCLCRAVRYEASVEPLFSRLCWCRLCQYVAAGNATVNTFFPAEAISFTGELRDYRSVADSGNVMHRRFCAACGIHVSTASEARPHLLAVRSGTLDDASYVKPVASIWTARAPAWACVDPNLPQFEGQPPPVG